MIKYLQASFVRVSPWVKNRFMAFIASFNIRSFTMFSFSFRDWFQNEPGLFSNSF